MPFLLQYTSANGLRNQGDTKWQLKQFQQAQINLSAEKKK